MAQNRLRPILNWFEKGAILIVAVELRKSNQIHAFQPNKAKWFWLFVIEQLFWNLGDDDESVRDADAFLVRRSSAVFLSSFLFSIFLFQTIA